MSKKSPALYIVQDFFMMNIILIVVADLM